MSQENVEIVRSIYDVDPGRHGSVGSGSRDRYAILQAVGPEPGGPRRVYHSHRRSCEGLTPCTRTG